MSQTMKARDTLRLAHPPRRLPAEARRPVPARLAIFLVGCLLVPVLVLVAELVQSIVRGWLA